MAYLIPIPFLVILVVVLIRAELLGKQSTIFVVKPICTLLVIAVAVLSWLTPAAETRYTAWILAGLVLSLGGDVALMFKSPRAFVAGLAAFLLAHVVYTSVFALYNGWQGPDWITAAVLLGTAVGAYAYLLPGLDRMKIPVALYILVICVMVHRAVSTLFGDAFTEAQGWLIAIGAFLFWISDLILGVNRFRRPFRYHRISLGFYYSGQLLIALSASLF
jgi:uncharacterized membrane protein YhhN